jgi:hypothetical protein
LFPLNENKYTHTHLMSTQLITPNNEFEDDGGISNTNRKRKQKKANLWYPQQELILKDWAETAGSFRYIHNRCSFSWRRWSIGFSLPIIALSTLTGVGNFAHASFPEQWKSVVPLVIGGINVIVGILGTIQRFLGVDEQKEAHHVASIGWGKLCRNIAVELSLPPQERSSRGREFIAFCRAEFDRLNEQSPDIHPKIAAKFNRVFKHEPFHKPEIVKVYPIKIYQRCQEDDDALNQDDEDNNNNGNNINNTRGHTNKRRRTKINKESYWDNDDAEGGHEKGGMRHRISASSRSQSQSQSRSQSHSQSLGHDFKDEEKGEGHYNNLNLSEIVVNNNP